MDINHSMTLGASYWHYSYIEKVERTFDGTL